MALEPTTVINIAAGFYIAVLIVQGLTYPFRKAKEKRLQDIENHLRACGWHGAGEVQDVEPAPREGYPHNTEAYWKWMIKQAKDKEMFQ